MNYVALLLATGCTSAEPIDTSWHQDAHYRWRDLAVASGGQDGFTLLTSQATGLTHRNDVDDAHAMLNRNLLIGAGGAIGDVDGDGRPDVFLASVERRAAPVSYTHLTLPTNREV